jgi:hypothetical protein
MLTPLHISRSHGCDFPGDDISSVKSRGEDCGPICATTNGCSKFSWYYYSPYFLLIQSFSGMFYLTFRTILHVPLRSYHTSCYALRFTPHFMLCPKIHTTLHVRPEESHHTSCSGLRFTPHFMIWSKIHTTLHVPP